MEKLIVAKFQQDHNFFYWEIIWSDKDLKERPQLSVKRENL